MPLNLDRRHRKDCLGGHPQDFRNGKFEETRRGWKKWDCGWIYVEERFDWTDRRPCRSICL
jgi:hypothetical protein